MKLNTIKPAAGSKTVRADTLQSLTFSGQPSADIPNAALVLSDPVAFPVQPGQVITVTLFLRHGQELEGREQSARLMRPADECFRAGDAAAVERHDRPVVQPELLVRDRLAELVLQPAARARAAISAPGRSAKTCSSVVVACSPT